VSAILSIEPTSGKQNRSTGGGMGKRIRLKLSDNS